MSDHPAPSRLPRQPESLEALRASEQAYRTLVELSYDLIWSVDAQGRWTFVNAAVRTIYGYEPAEMLGRPFTEFQTPEQAKKDLAEFARIKAGTPAFNYETVHRRKDGTPIHLNFNAVFLRDEDGTVVGTTGTAQDITERKRAEAALQASERELRLITNHVPALVSRVDRNLRYLFINDQYERVFGKPRAAVLGRSMVEVLGVDIFQRVEPQVRRVLAGEAVTFEDHMRTDAGGTLNWLLSFVPDRDEERNVVGFLVVAIEITARKQTEEALQREQSLFASLLQTIPDHVYFKDRQSRFLRINAMMAQRFGLREPAAAIGQTDLDFFGEVHARQTFADEQRVMSSGAPIIAVEEKETWPDGQITWVSSTKVAVRDAAGQIAGLVGISRDITERKQSELARERSHSLTLATLESTADGILVVDAEGKIDAYNHVFTRMWCLPDDVLAARDDARAMQFVLEQLSEPEKWLERIRHLYAHPEEESFDTLAFKDGRMFERYSRPQMIGGQVVGRVWSFRDVTERRQVEAALRRSEAQALQRLREIEQIYAYSPIGLFIFDREDRFLRVNERMAEINGFPVAYHLGKNLKEIVPELAAFLKETYRPVFERGEPVLNVEIHGKTPRDPDHERDWIGNYFPLKSETGEVIGMMGAVLEITERKQAEAALLESDRRLTTLISNLPGYVFRVANDATYTPEFISAGVEAVTGYSPREYLVDRTISCGAEIHPEDRDAFWAIVQRAIAAREAYECEYRIVTKTGETKWVWERGRGNYAATGEPTTLEGFVTDITTRKQLEEQLRQVQKLEAVGQLAGGVAHDFNNLLTVIQGHLALLEAQSNESAVARESLGEIKQAADRAANLTRQLLTFSRRQAIRPSHVDLNDVVTNMARMLQRILGEDIAMELHLSPHQVGVLADIGMIEQVLLNLAVNSRDAMPRGGRLLIETAVIDFDDTSAARMLSARPGAFVCLSTTDTGTGIPAHILPRIFEPFFTTKETGKGTGLGLATVYGIVQQHDGWIAVDSAPGRGTNFHIYLPRQSGVVTAALPQSESPARGGHETILLVEDEPSLRALVSTLLGRQGYHVIAAANGPQALELWREHASEIKLLVTDLVMPDGMSGFDLGGQLTREAPQLRVIYTSGYSPEMAGRSEALVAGVNFLAKPFEVEAMLRTIRAALDSAAS